MKTGMFIFATVFSCIALATEPVWFNSGINNRDITFSPDGELMLTTLVAPKNQFSIIAMSRKVNGHWTPLETAPFSGQHADIEAMFHPSGNWVYFASKRPKPDREGADWDLWRVSFMDNTFGEPENLGAPVNSIGNEFYPSITNDGTLYFTATLEGGLGHEDLYLSRLQNGEYQAIENVGAPVNSAAYEFNAFIAPDESYLVFGGQRRPGEKGGGDMYISFRHESKFGEPSLLPEPITTRWLDYCPMVWGDRFYFSSQAPTDGDMSTVEAIHRRYTDPGNGFGDIYSVPLSEILPVQ